VGGTVRAATAALPAGTPDLAQIALGPADLPGAKVSRQRYVDNPDVVASYEREFKAGVRVGNGTALSLENDIDVLGSADTAHSYYASIKSLFGSKQGRLLFTKSILAGVEKDTKAKGTTKVTYGRLRTLGVGSETFVQPVTVTMKSLRFPIALSVTRGDRIVSWVFLTGFPGGRVATEDVARLQRIVAGRITTALTPANTVLPTVTGTAMQGQVLTGTDGAWTNKPTTFTRQWQRCDASGAACVPIPGATAQAYTVALEDVGATIRYSVVAANTAGTSISAVSAQTAAVVAAPAPPPAG